jgi:hypothetical protein
MASPRLLLSLGLVLMLTGIILPYLMLAKVVESTFFLNIISWDASVAGMFLGFIGGSMWVKMNKEE